MIFKMKYKAEMTPPGDGKEGRGREEYFREQRPFQLRSLGKEKQVSSEKLKEAWRSPGGVHSNPLQYSCLEKPMDRGACRATVHRVAESDTTEVT